MEDQPLTKLTPEELQTKPEATQATIQMQDIYYARMAQEQAQNDQKYSDKEEDTNKFLAQIKEVKKKVSAGTASYDDLKETLFQYVFTIAAPQSDQTVAKVRDEVTVALESVLPASNLTVLISLDSAATDAQLDELSQIVSGIRLFHRLTQRGSEDLLDYALLCENDVAELLTQIQFVVTESQKTELSEVLMMNKEIEQGLYKREEYKMSLDLRKAELWNRSQFRILCEELFRDSLEINSFVARACEEYHSLSQQLLNNISGKKSVPKAQIYPLFIRLSRVWRGLSAAYDDIITTRYLFASILPNAYPRHDNIEKQLEELGQFQLEDLPTVSFVPTISEEERDQLLKEEADRLQQGQPPTLIPEDLANEVEAPGMATDVQIVPHTHSSFDSLQIDFNSFCPVCLVRRQGLLMGGDPTLGCAVWNSTDNETFSVLCSDESCLRSFCQNPRWFVSTILKACKESPELVYLLKLNKHFTDFEILAPTHPILTRAQLFAQLPTTVPQQVRMVDSDSQTPHHFVTQKIVPKYEWNEWNMRREALKLVSLKTKRTLSSQTTQSHFRREAETQAYEMVDSSTNTGVDAGTSAKRHIMYVKGLRGKPTEKVEVVRVELDMNDDPAQQRKRP
ncbi:putative Cilia- and flagella-associated protein 206 [Blattamonas nauphoetae]|uniref:Cilia- and flagella-associated protein 206 n=1 Tax=Blattamonas nauphoetae TaxID=2049346 RepID=A0ABQ9YKD2_9EUKA|nr:putative Cilia- and flagella-associated protein 206 [Blattamonas nauphoetae]